MCNLLEKIRKVDLLSAKGRRHFISKILQETARRTGESFGGPDSAILVLTNRCNARCVHCHSWKMKSTGKELSDGEWKKTLDELYRWVGAIDLAITGGETLLRPGAIDIAEHAASLGFWVDYLTNGYIMNRENAARLVDSGVSRINISLDGSTPEIHNAVRGRDDFFDQSINALKMLVSERDKQQRDVQIWGKTTIMNINVGDLPNIIELAAGIGLNGVLFQALEPIYYSEELTDPKWYQKNPLWVKDLSVVSNSLQRLREQKEEGFPVANTFESLEMIREYFRDPEGLSFKVHSHEYNKKKPDCTSWYKGLQFMPDGGMKMCLWMEPFANAREGSFRQAWRNRKKCWKENCAMMQRSDEKDLDT